MTTKTMARLQVEISDELKDRVRIDAAVRNIAQSQLVTEALDLYFASRDKAAAKAQSKG